MQAAYSTLSVLPLNQGGEAPRVDLMASQIDVQFLTIKTFVWFLLFLWCHPECNRVAFWDASQVETLGEEPFIFHVPMHAPEYSPDNSRSGES